MKLVIEPKEFTFRKEDFQISYHYYLCEDTDETFDTEELMGVNLNQVHNQFREKHNLPFPEEIKEIRKKYDLPASKMSEILGFGTNQYRNYENGEVPSISNARLIQLVNDPKEFMRIVELSKALEGSELKRTTALTEQLTSKESDFCFSDIETYYMKGNTPSGVNGYRKFNLEKFCNMVYFFVENVKPWKVKLNKLLFYSDFLHFKKTCFSMSGAKYMAIQMGPVPMDFDGLLGEAIERKFVNVELYNFDDGNVGEFYKPGENTFNKALFSEIEFQVLEKIADTFRAFSTQKMVEVSHQEKGWIDCIEKHQIISYNYGFNLRAV